MPTVSEVLKHYMSKESLTLKVMANRFGVPRQTMGDWLRGAVPKKPEHKSKLLERLPELKEILAGNTHSHSSQVLVKIPERREVQREVDPIDLRIKLILAEQMFASLEPLLEWFLFFATVREREQFREYFGKRWIRFVDLARALRVEQTFQVLEQEGKLKKEKENE